MKEIYQRAYTWWGKLKRENLSRGGKYLKTIKWTDSYGEVKDFLNEIKKGNAKKGNKLVGNRENKIKQVEKYWERSYRLEKSKNRLSKERKTERERKMNGESLKQ